MKSVCVFAGARDGSDPKYLDAARALGERLGRRGIRLVYGGSNRGLMGSLARAAIECGAEVVGVSARAVLRPESVGPPLPMTEFIIADSMHERKAAMFERCDGFIALPGGIGTIDELIEVWSWRHLGIHKKPIGLLETGNFWLPLLQYFERLKEAELMRRDPLLDPIVDSDPDELLDCMIAQVGCRV